MSDDQASRGTARHAAASRPAQPTRARLRAVHPLGLGWDLELGPQPAELGRIDVEGGPPALVHGTVSRRHFEVRWDASLRCHVGRDLGSHNGSRVDGHDLGRSTAMLRDGCVIQLADVSLVYEEIPDDAPASMPAHPLIPGRSPAIAPLVDALDRAARDASPVLLWGESGTGKQHIARALHEARGGCGPLVVIECAGFPRGPGLRAPRRERDDLGPSTSHGAPSPFDAAPGSTVYLDELTELSSPLQRELLRALVRAQERGDPRAEGVQVVAATSHDLAERVAEGRVRRDLYATLARGELRVPPLRERRGDVLVWLERLHVDWLERRPRHLAQTLALTPEAAEQVLLHTWPGNLHSLERLVDELASDPELPRPIPRQRLPAWLLGGSPDVPTQPVSGPPIPRRSPARA